MNYLTTFTHFFSSPQEPNISSFSEFVLDELRKSKNGFTQDGIIFDLEPIKVKEEMEENDQYRIFHYKGTYIYGFQKNGVFHEIPGDLSTQTERAQNELGEVIFYVNKTTDKIDTIYESFAGNTTGLKQKKKHPFFWITLAILLAIAWFVFYKNIS